jgi:hypothetical protein
MEPSEHLAQAAPSPGAPDAVVFDVPQEKDVCELRLDGGSRSAGRGKDSEHGGFDRNRPTLGDAEAPVRVTDEEGLGEVAAGQPFQSILRNAGESRHARGESRHRASLSASASAPSVTSRQVTSKWSSEP